MYPVSPTLCEHLQPLLTYLQQQGCEITYAGQPWSRNCRLWVYVDAVLDLSALRSRLVPACVTEHVHRGTHDGAEQGFVCSIHHDAVMGLHPDFAAGRRTIL